MMYYEQFVRQVRETVPVPEAEVQIYDSLYQVYRFQKRLVLMISSGDHQQYSVDQVVVSVVSPPDPDDLAKRWINLAEDWRTNWDKQPYVALTSNDMGEELDPAAGQ